MILLPDCSVPTRKQKGVSIVALQQKKGRPKAAFSRRCGTDPEPKPADQTE
jgi:hypothetical protein